MPGGNAPSRIHIICDNVRYYHAQRVKDYLANAKIKLVFLLPYAPNLNLIERFWKFFKKTVLHGRYYETFSPFKTACDNFFAGLDQHHASLRSLGEGGGYEGRLPFAETGAGEEPAPVLPHPGLPRCLR